METKKKETNAQLKRRIEKSPLHLDFTKNTKSVYFDDKGLRLTVDDSEDKEGYAIIETGYHRHVFSAYNYALGDLSRPYAYTLRFVEIALENDCTTKDEHGNVTRSFARLFEVLKAKEDKAQYNIARFFQMWLHNIYSPLFEIGLSVADAFLVHERYMHNIARNAFLLEEHKENVTNKQFVDKILELEKSFMEDIEEHVILEAKTDEQRIQEEMEAVQADMAEQAMEQGVGQTTEDNGLQND